MRLLTVDGHWRRLDDGFESDLKVTTPRRWFRGGLFYGEAPGSHMIGKHLTAWRTRVDGLRGVNVRFGWWPRPCVTVLLHTRPVCAEDVPRAGADVMDRVLEGLRQRLGSLHLTCGITTDRVVLPQRERNPK